MRPHATASSHTWPCWSCICIKPWLLQKRLRWGPARVGPTQHQSHRYGLLDRTNRGEPGVQHFAIIIQPGINSKKMQKNANEHKGGQLLSIHTQPVDHFGHCWWSLPQMNTMKIVCWDVHFKMCWWYGIHMISYDLILSHFLFIGWITFFPPQEIHGHVQSQVQHVYKLLHHWRNGLNSSIFQQ